MSHLRATKEKGFTLVEVLIALTIFSIAISGVITVAAQGGLNINSAKYRLTANYLATEGIEMMRAVRDNRVLYYTASNPTAAAAHAGWVDFETAALRICGTDAPACDIDSENFAGVVSNFPDVANITPCYSGSCKLSYDNSVTTSPGYYNNQNFGIETLFSRALTVTSISDHEVQVTSTVTWLEGSATRSVVTRENMFDWYN